MFSKSGEGRFSLVTKCRDRAKSCCFARGPNTKPMPPAESADMILLVEEILSWISAMLRI